MNRPGLRVVPPAVTATANGERVSMRLRDLFPLLDQARRSNLAWLRDLGDDTIDVSADLAEILNAYRAIVEERWRA